MAGLTKMSDSKEMGGEVRPMQTCDTAVGVTKIVCPTYVMAMLDKAEGWIIRILL